MGTGKNSWATQRLAAMGYLPQPEEIALADSAPAVRAAAGPADIPAASEGQLQRAIERFQIVYGSSGGMTVTGKLDAATTEALNRPSCGASDFEGMRDGRATLSRSEERLAFAIAQGVPQRYFLKARPNQMEVDTRRFLEVRRAFATWSAQGVEFQEVGDEAEADIVVRWVRSTESTFDLSGDTIAQADFPKSSQRPLRLDLDDDHTWVTSNGGGFDIESVALHEIGHLLGLRHQMNPDAVMYRFFNGVKRSLHRLDVLAVRRLHRL